MRSVLFIGLSFASALQAAGYQSFSTLSYAETDRHGMGTDRWGINTRYYLDKKQALGPLAEFEYINTVDNLSAGYSHYNGGNSLVLGAEAFVGNWLMGAKLSRNNNDWSDSRYTSLSVGYLFSPNLLVKVTNREASWDTAYNGEEYSSDRTGTEVSAQYSHQLSGNDYIGVTLTAGDRADDVALTSKYFTSLGNGRFITLAASAAKHQYSDPSYAISGAYYFSPKTSVSAGVSTLNDLESYTIGAEHFVSDNWSVGAHYASSEEVVYRSQGISTVVLGKQETVNLRVKAQF